jgi:hypothetical protein
VNVLSMNFSARQQPSFVIDIVVHTFAMGVIEDCPRLEPPEWKLRSVEIELYLSQHSMGVCYVFDAFLHTQSVKPPTDGVSSFGVHPHKSSMKTPIRCVCMLGAYEHDDAHSAGLQCDEEVCIHAVTRYVDSQTAHSQ